MNDNVDTLVLNRSRHVEGKESIKHDHNRELTIEMMNPYYWNKWDNDNRIEQMNDNDYEMMIDEKSFGFLKASDDEQNFAMEYSMFSFSYFLILIWMFEY